MNRNFAETVVAGAVALWAMALFGCSGPNDPAAAPAPDVTPSATAAATRPSAPFASTAKAPPPALTFEFLDASGTFVAPAWDDREIGQEQKDADPWLNPAWVPF